MKSKIVLLIALILLGCMYLGFAEKEKLFEYLASLIENNVDSPREKVYVHTDKAFYLPGEDIWFSVYLVNDGTYTGSNISNVVYVDLINPKGNVIAKRTLAAVDGNSEGDFQLDTLDPGGIYTIKAYTHWLKNFGEDNFFERKITVQKIITPRVLMKLDFEKEAYGQGDEVIANFSINNLKNEPLQNLSLNYAVNISGSKISEGTAISNEEGRSKIVFHLPRDLTSHDGLLNISLTHEGFSESISRSVPIVLNRIDLQFFPEGGAFISGLPNRVAFKALNEFGKPADVEGVVMDERGRKIVNFVSFHDGMGAFSMVPQPGKLYRVRVTKPQGIDQEFSLPVSVSTGISMTIDNVGGKEISLTLYASKKEKIHLVAHQSDKIFFSQSVSLEKGKNRAQVPIENAHAGTALLTLFNEEGEPTNERLIFVNRHKKLNIQLETDKERYAPGAEVELKIKTTDESGSPVSSRLSLAVVNDRVISFADDKQDNIRSWLLMSSDLKGDIHEPNFYFDENEPNARQALDYVMMTHGWRKFSWKTADEPITEIAFHPEKIGNISGVVMNKRKGEAIRAEVYAFELGPKRRAAKVETDKTGRFTFKNIDPGYDLAIFAYASFKNRHNIDIQVEANYLESVSGASLGASSSQSDDNNIPTVIRAEVKEKTETDAVAKRDTLGENEINIALNENVTALEEVVVVGYGQALKRAMTSSIVVVREEDISIVPFSSFENALQGRAAGVVVSENSGIPGNPSNVRIRGFGSVSNSEPLVVVDGVPVLSANAIPLLNDQNINSIEILKGPSAASIYGCLATNGAILISTNHHRWNYNRRFGEKSFASYTVRSQRFYRAREFYQPAFHRKNQQQKQQLSSTVYWNPDIVTNSEGKAAIRFKNADEVSSFRMTAEGISREGKIGRHEQTLQTVLPLSVDTKIPPFVCFGDKLSIPVIIQNNTDERVDGTFALQIPSAFEPLVILPERISIPANSSHTEWIRMKVLNEEGKFPFTIGFAGQEHSDTTNQSIQVLPMGFPVQASLSGYDLSKKFEVDIHNPVEGSVKAKFVGYTSALNELMDGVASIIREPYGCFEQTSSSTYPNVLALQLLKEMNYQDPEIKSTAEKYVAQGYKRLLTFETKEGGFEWFGRTPPHEGLTAYGLMEFFDMQKVYKGVDPKLIERTADWLLSRKDGKGGFKRSSKALDSFGRCNNEVSNAYITYAFTEVGKGNLVWDEFGNAYREAWESKDSYRMALMANAALNLHDYNKAEAMILELLKQISPDGSGNLGADHSMVRSYGNSLQVEIRALLLMALLKQKETPNAVIIKQVNYLVSKREAGGFGSTQATILSLKALSMYAVAKNTDSGAGDIALTVNQNIVSKQSYGNNSWKPVIIGNLEKLFKMGKYEVGVDISNAEKPIPYSLDISWTSYTPGSSPHCKLAISTSFSSSRVKLGETVRMEVELKNLTREGLPMTMAILGIPSGLSVQPWQLKELLEKEIFDFYEIRDNYLVLYYRQMAPQAVRHVYLDLKSEFPGTFGGPASAAYLYYTEEDKHWIDGEKIEIE